MAEVVLVAGPEAALAPAWVPWSERLRPGDLGVGDLLVTEADDPRLAPAYAEADDDELAAVSDELYLGRVRVLSDLGRIEAAERWSEGEFGPDAPIAKAAPGPCGTCAFLVPLQGAIRGAPSASAPTPIATADGRVVTVDHGCGGHSEAVVVTPPEPLGDVLDDDQLRRRGPSASLRPGAGAGARHLGQRRRRRAPRPLLTGPAPPAQGGGSVPLGDAVGRVPGDRGEASAAEALAEETEHDPQRRHREPPLHVVGGEGAAEHEQHHEQHRERPMPTRRTRTSSASRGAGSGLRGVPRTTP